jgi:hypothetical protein
MYEKGFRSSKNAVSDSKYMNYYGPNNCEFLNNIALNLRVSRIPLKNTRYCCMCHSCNVLSEVGFVLRKKGRLFRF